MTSPPSASKPPTPSTVNGTPPSACEAPSIIPPFSNFCDLIVATCIAVCAATPAAAIAPNGKPKFASVLVIAIAPFATACYISACCFFFNASFSIFSVCLAASSSIFNLCCSACS